MKIGVAHIIRGHFSTLWNGADTKTRLEDTGIFVALPLIIGGLCLACDLKFTKEFYNLSITFFGIFIALLLNIQVAIFGLFQRSWVSPKDEMLVDEHMDKIEQRRTLLQQVNLNVSYLIVLSCVCLVADIILFVLETDNWFSKIVTPILYAHFMLTLLMIVKRTHALFQREYEV